MRRLLILLAVVTALGVGLLAIAGQTSAQPKDPTPTEHPKATETQAPKHTPEPTKTQAPKHTPEPTKTQAPKHTPEPTEAKPDQDADGVPDVIDNCLTVANKDQADSDKDGIGDACDDDIDGDGLPNKQEQDQGTNPKSSDTDGDHCGDRPEEKHALGDKIASDPLNPLDFDDLTGDSKVRSADILAVAQHYNNPVPGIYDRTGDGIVHAVDILHVAHQYGANCAGL